MSAFQPMPDLTAEEHEALRADIAARGIITPVVVDQHGRILDGNNRVAIAAELGIDYPTTVRQVADDTEAEDLAVTLNCARRHLTREQRRELIRREIERKPDDSDRAIARRIGCSPSTVGAVRNPAPKVSNLDTWDRPTDVDPALRAAALDQYDRWTVTSRIPATDAAATRARHVMVQDADNTLWATMALINGADPLELAVAVVARMVLWKSLGMDRALIRRLFEPWIDLALSPSTRQRFYRDPLGWIEDANGRSEFVAACLDQVASIPKAASPEEVTGDE